MEAGSRVAELRAVVEETLEQLGIEPETLADDKGLDELDIDSLDIVEVSQVVSQRFQVKLEAEDFEGVATYGDVVGVLEKKVS